jgi:hypothetical protein
MKARVFCLVLSVALLMVMLGLVVHGSATAMSPGLAPETNGGAVAIWDPSTLHVAQEETFRLVFTVPPGGFPEGSQLKVQDADFHGMGWTMFQRFQTMTPTVEGYMTVTCSAPGVTVSVARFETGPQQMSYSIVTVVSGSLGVGEVLTMTYGDTSVSPQGSATSPHRAYQHVAWPIAIDTDGGGFHPLSELPTMDIAPDPNPAHMFATAPTYVQKGISFDLAVRVLDDWGNACIDYGGMLSFSSTDGAATLPADTVFPAGTGFRRFPVTLNTTGIHYLDIDDGGTFSINSNPIVVVDEAPEEQIFWGDLHGHHGHIYTFTIGVSPTIEVRVDEYMEYARDVSDLDFACESHKSSAYWNVSQVHEDIAESILQYESSEFVPFRGFEWMGKKSQNEGHHNVYYLAADGPYWSPDEDESDSLDELYRQAANSGYEALIIPHAPSYSGHNWSKFLADDLNARFRRQGEIYSHWDLSEELDRGSMRAGWVTGNRMGTIASTDGHFNYPGLPIGDVCDPDDPGGPECPEGRTANGGLTAVYAPHLTRQHLWQGLKQRHTYGTDGMRLYLAFSADGVPMGEQVRTTSAPHLEVVAAGTADIEKVEVFRGTYAEVPADPGPTEDYYTTVYSATPMTLTTTFAFDDTGFSEDCFYYVRVSQTDGRRAWSSPIWVDYAPPPADLWAGCDNGAADPGENLVTCAPDTQFAHTSELQVTDGRPRLLASGVSLPLTGLRVYNVENVDSYVPYGTSGWLAFMQRQVDRVKFAGAHFLGINAHGMRLYTGDEASDPADPGNWQWGPLDDLFNYAAEQGVYLIPAVQTDSPPVWWIETHEGAMQTDDEGTIWGRVTFNNPGYWTLADELLTHVIHHYRDHPALLAWDFRVGEGENNYSPPYVQNIFNPPDTWCDYSPQAVVNWRLWLTATYGNDEALRTAWDDSSVTIDTAEIPLPRPEVTPSNESEVLPYANGPGDTRREFYDWHHFRLEEKMAETAHFGELFRTEDPYHVILSDPAYVPLAGGNRLRWGTLDGETLYRSPYIDALIEQPRFGHTDQGGGFTVARETLYETTQYALHHNRLQTWAKEETSEMNDPGGDQENLWRLDSAAILHAALGQGDGWVTGSVTDTMLPAWSDGERAEMARLAGLFSAPGLRSPQPEIAVLSDPLDAFDYFVGGQVAPPYLRGGDRSQFLETAWKNGLAFDILTVDDVRLEPDRLADYQAILIVNQARLPLDVAGQLAAYRDGGGGLFVGGRTGIYDELGCPDDSALETLLGVSIVATQTTDYETWSFDNAPDPLLDGLQGLQYADDNLYHIPTFNMIAEGYYPLGHLATGAPPAATAGRKGQTVFWFPRLGTETSEHLATFQRNLWSFFGVGSAVTAEGEVEIAGDTHLNLFSPVSQTVQVRYPPTMTGALVWDWNAMDLVGPVPPGPQPELALHADANSSAFLGTFVPGSGPQLVAVSGASLARSEYLSATNTFAVVLYRTVPGLQIQVAIHPGDLSVEEAAVEGGGLDHAGFDRSGQVYLVQATPTDERMTVSVQFGREAIYVPLVTRSD